MKNALKLGCAGLLLSVAMSAESTAPATLDVAAERYRPELAAAVEQCLTGAQTMREHIVAKDLEGAKQAWIASRVGWERSEVFTSGFTSELDAAIDAWPSAVAGFHYIEARLFGARAEVDSDQVRATSEDLVLSLQKAATALGLERPSLSDLAQQ